MILKASELPVRPMDLITCRPARGHMKCPHRLWAAFSFVVVVVVVVDDSKVVKI